MGTFWFSSPVVIDLDRNGSTNEIIACGESCKVLDSSLNVIQTLSSGGNRIYAGQCVVDLDGNGKLDLCYAASAQVYCHEWNPTTRQFVARSGWPVTAKRELRGMACADIDVDGRVDVLVASTDSSTQNFAYNADGTPKRGWPRYNTASGPDEDALPDSNHNGRNSFGHYRYGSYGMNIGVGNIDDDANLEIITTYDNHQIQAFKSTGLALNMAPSYTNLRSPAQNKPVTWGQATPRWTNKTTDDYQWNQHAPGCYANPLPTCSPCVAGGDEWLQFTESPASVADLDGDGMAEVITLPNSEKDTCCNGGGYVSTQRVVFVLDGAYGNNGDPHIQAPRSGLRHVGFDGTWPPQGRTVTCQQCFDATGSCGTCRVTNCGSHYPPAAVPLVAFADLLGSTKQVLVAPFSDGTIRGFLHTGVQSFMFDFASDLGINSQTQATDASEVAIADLNKDGSPEIVFTVYGIPTANAQSTQYLYILDKTGAKLQRIAMNVPAVQGTCSQCSATANGCGAAGAPTIADINNDGQLEILVNTFDGRIIVWTVPGSAPNCILWPTGRGGYMKKGQPDYSYNG